MVWRTKSIAIIIHNFYYILHKTWLYCAESLKPFCSQFRLYTASHPSFFMVFFFELAVLPIFFGKIAPIKYRIKTEINPCGRVIFSCLKDHKTNLHDILYPTLLHETPGWDLTQSLLFINKKRCFPPFLQVNNRGGGGVEFSHYKWCANDILKITLIPKIILLFPSINKNIPFTPLCNLLLLTFWHSSFC